MGVDALEDPIAQANSALEAVAVIAGKGGQIVETGGVGTVDEVRRVAPHSGVRRPQPIGLETERGAAGTWNTGLAGGRAIRRDGCSTRTAVLGPERCRTPARVPRKARRSTANKRPSTRLHSKAGGNASRPLALPVGSSGRELQFTHSPEVPHAPPMPGIAVLRVMPCRAPGGKNGLCGLGEICGSKLGFSRAPQEYLWQLLFDPNHFAT